MNQRDLYTLLHEIEQCGYSAERANDIAENMSEMEEVRKVRKVLNDISSELYELKRKLREMIRSFDDI